MKVSAAGLLTQVADALPKRATVENQTDMYRFMLREMVKHIEQVRKGELSLQSFTEFYCITPQLSSESGNNNGSNA